MAKKIRVLQLIESWGPGGAEKVVLELARGMDRNRFEPFVGLLHTGWLHQQLEEHGIETILIENKHSFDPFFLRKLLKIVREKKVELIHAHEFTMNVYGAIVAHLTGISSLATVHGNKYYPDRRRRRSAYRLISSLPKTQVVTVSKSLKEYFCEINRVNPAAVETVYNGVNCSSFNGQKKSFNKGFDLGRDAGPFIGTIGNLYPGKGHIYLIQAASLLAAHLPYLKILIIGKNTKYRSCLEEEAEKLNIRENVQFLGFQDDIPSLLRNLNLFVLPSLQETFSIAVIEAMAAGLPIIATKCGGPEEIITDGVNGFLVPPCDHQALAEKMFLLMGDKELRMRIAKKAREDVVKDFSIERMISSYQSLYLKKTRGDRNE